MFYHRSKFYGFIRPNDGSKEVYVNRSAIDCPVSAMESPRHPHLRRDDPVSYEIVEAPATFKETPGGSRLQARNVRQADGQPIPLLRKSFYMAAHHGAHQDFGKAAWDLADRVETMTAEELKESLKDAKRRALGKVEAAERLIQRFGMKVEDFPKEPEGRGGARQGGVPPTQPTDVDLESLLATDDSESVASSVNADDEGSDSAGADESTSPTTTGESEDAVAGETDSPSEDKSGATP